MMCNFSSLIWPAGSAPAALASLLVDPPERQIIGKNAGFRDFPTFSRTWIFFLRILFLFDILSSSLLFSSLLFSDSSHLCFSSVHIVGNLISKLPSTTTTAAAAATMIFFLYGFVFHLGLQHETHEVSHSGTWIFFFCIFIFFDACRIFF